MTPAGRPPLRLLASVRSAEEALLACARAGEVDLVDAKEPRQGALGSLPSITLEAIVRAVAGRVPVSATTGDLPLDAQALGAAMARVAACGVDYVKIGIFGPPQAGRLEACLAALPQVAGTIAVLMADQGGADWPLEAFARQGFAGVMLDTADKRAGSLGEVLSLPALAGFVRRAQAHGLLCGLAGSLRLADVDRLRTLHPDYLGFRTALCAQGQRTAGLDSAALRAVAGAVHGTDGGLADAGISAPAWRSAGS